MKIKYILPIVVVVLLLVGVAILAMTLSTSNNEFVKNITLLDNGVSQESFKLSANGLTPGSAREYAINLKGASGNYKLKFDFVEVTDGSLKNFVDVTLQYGEKNDTYKLAELLDGKAVGFNCRVGSKDATVIKVIYSMSMDIGNEAQNATVDFEIKVTAEQY